MCYLMYFIFQNSSESKKVWVPKSTRNLHLEYLMLKIKETTKTTKRKTQLKKINQNSVPFYVFIVSKVLRIVKKQKYVRAPFIQNPSMPQRLNQYFVCLLLSWLFRPIARRTEKL